MWFLAATIPLFLFARDIAIVHHGSLAGRAYWGRDFVILWTGGQLVHEGAIATIYNVPAFQAKLAALFGSLEPMGYPYPPVTFPIAFLFGLLPYSLAVPLWFATTGGLFLWACRRWWTPAMGPRWAAVVTPAALINIWAGHYAFLLGALFLLGWERLDRRPAAAGVFFGCMLIKPHLAILIPLALFLRRSWAAFFSAAFTVIGLIAATTAIYGWHAWRDYLLKMTGPQVSLINAQDGFFTFMSTSTTTAVLRWTNNERLALAAQMMVAVGALLMLVAAVRRRPCVRDLALLVATLTFLVLPYGFNYDLTVVMIGALTLVARTDAQLRFRLLAAVGFLAPAIGMLFASERVPAIPIMLALLAFAQFRCLRVEGQVAASFNAQSGTHD